MQDEMMGRAGTGRFAPQTFRCRKRPGSACITGIWKVSQPPIAWRLGPLGLLQHKRSLL